MGSGPFVHVSKKGIFINDREDETFLSINKDGINISDGSSSNCDENYDFVNDNGKRKVVYSEKAKNKRIIKKVADLITGIMALIIAVIYVVLGIFIEGCWETMWPLFLTILIPEGLIKAIGLRKINRFPITWIALTTYFFLGTLLPNNQGWHPYWVILFIIPIFYAIAGSIIQINKEKKKNSYIDDDVTIEIDEEKDED